MWRTGFVPWSGLAAMVGGILWIATLVLTATKPEHSRRGPEGLIIGLLAGLLLMALGMVGLYLRQRHRAGRFGTLAVLMTGAGIVFTVVGRVAVDVLDVPVLVFRVGLLTFISGLVLVVISIFRANVISRAATLVLAMGIVALTLFNFGDGRIWFGTIFGLAWIWLGYALWAGEGRQERVSRLEEPGIGSQHQ